MTETTEKISFDDGGRNALPYLPGRGRIAITVIIGVSIVLVTILHFLTPTDQIVWHEIYQRLYYIPIISAALLFGLRGGLSASLLTTLLYLPHIYLHWQSGHFDYSINQYAETVVFIVVGAVMGALGDRLRHARERAERNAEERRLAYVELQETFQQLLQAEKLAALGELSAGIVHEVRNPLAAIKGAVEILEDEIAPESPRREFASLARREIERLDKLVGEFLRFARPATISVQQNALNDIVESVRALIENQAAAQSVKISLDLQPDNERIPLDAEQIKQVLLNLAINSLQAMPDGGSLILRTFSDGQYCSVAVEDTGGGIDESIVPKIFDPFFTARDQGVGLGLSVAHKIVAQHRGRLTYRQGSRGAIFELSLPC